MKKELKVSIIIPVYNVEQYIGNCLRSVMRQTYQGAMECLLIDDCGADDSIVIAEKIIAEYDANANLDGNLNVDYQGLMDRIHSIVFCMLGNERIHHALGRESREQEDAGSVEQTEEIRTL